MSQENIKEFKVEENLRSSEGELENDTLESGARPLVSTTSENGNNHEPTCSSSVQIQDTPDLSRDEVEEVEDNLPGSDLFDDELLDPVNYETTLDFEDIPYDIDIDEPIEMEQLSRFGRIMNVVILITIIIFCITVLCFIINATSVISAVSFVNIKTRTFAHISDLDNNSVGSSSSSGGGGGAAKIDLKILTEATKLGRFIKGRMDDSQEVNAYVYLIGGNGENNNGNFIDENLMLRISYSPSKDIKFDFGEERMIEMKDIKMNFNDKFNSSRLSGFMEPRNGTTFHARYPRKVIVVLKALLEINSFWVPIPFPLQVPFEFSMDIIDEELEKLKQAKIKAFDFMPKKVHIHKHDHSSPADENPLIISIDQPVPKFYGPPGMIITIDIPKMTLLVKQFEMVGMNNPFAVPEIEPLFKDHSKSVAAINIKPCAFVLSDLDQTPNILKMDVTINYMDKGLMNILTAIRDDKTKQLGLLFSLQNFKAFSKSNDPDPDPDHENSSERFNAISFFSFMEPFWGRQAYPAGGEPVRLLGAPENYNPLHDSALNIKFDSFTGFSSEENKNAKLKFTIKANKQYIGSKYNVPLSMISGEIPRMDFSLNVNDNRPGNVSSAQAAYVTIQHLETTETDRELCFEITIEIMNLKNLTLFLLKSSRSYEVLSKNLNPRENKSSDLDVITSGSFVGVGRVSWPSNFARIFSLKICFNNDQIQVFYENDRQSNPYNLLASSPKKEEKEEEKEKLNESKQNLITSQDLLNEFIELLEITQQLDSTLFIPDFMIKHISLFQARYLEERKGGGDHAENAESKKYRSFKTPDKTDEVDNSLKLVKARQLLAQFLELKRIEQDNNPPRAHGIRIDVKSNKNNMKIGMTANLAEISNRFDDRILFEWDKIDLDFFYNSNVRLANFNISQGAASYYMGIGKFFYAKFKSLKSTVEVGSDNNDENPGLLQEWMKLFDSFYSKFSNPDQAFIDLFIKFPNSNNLVPAFIPGPKIKALKYPVVTSPEIDEIRPDFFGNLSKSYFDFIGYGFYRLLFNVMLPNPDTCPSGSEVYNVELELPQTVAFLFAQTAEYPGVNFAAINTAQRLRIWTQIVDNVVCNMYSVVDGRKEHKLKIHGLIPSIKANPVIKSFISTLYMEKEAADLQEELDTLNEYPLKNLDSDELRKKKSKEETISLSLVIPITIEFLNFGHFMKVMDDYGEKKNIKLFIGDPSTPQVSENIPQSFINNFIGHLASNIPFALNTPEQLAYALENPTKKFLHVKDKMIFRVDALSPGPDELSLNLNIIIPKSDTGTSGTCLNSFSSSYIPFNQNESIETQNQFKHPIIRWGKTTIRFAFKTFIVTFSLSQGDIKVTENNRKILFEGLRDLKIEINVKARPNRKHPEFRTLKDLFKTSSIRQIFKKCVDSYNEKPAATLDYPNKKVKTTSSVIFGEGFNSQFHFIGEADMESLFALQGVIGRKVMPRNSSVILDPDSPTYMKFSMLVKMGENESSNTDGFSTEKTRSPVVLPTLSLPCFFTNFCSSEQLSYSQLNDEGLLYDGDNVPIKLHIRDTFQPLAASIASGLSTFLTLFHMDYYPETLEWQLNIPDEQVISMEMNGLGLFVGKTDPLTIVKNVEIPYQNFTIDYDIPRKARKNGSSSANYKTSSSSTKSKSWLNSIVTNIKTFEQDDFYREELVVEFKDEVVIPLKLQFPESLPKVLRNTLWPMFSLPFSTISLHPPFLGVNETVNTAQMTQLGHTPMSMAMSDSIDYISSDQSGNQVVKKSSLLAKVFAAFVEESSSPGIEAHKIKPSVDTPSSRFHFAFNLDDMKTISGQIINVICWVQMPWAMNTIGLDFGNGVSFNISMPGVNGTEQYLIKGSLAKHHMIGEIARMRFDLFIPVNLLKILSKIVENINLTNVINLFYKNLDLSSLGANIPYKAEFIIGNNFKFETEFTVPKALTQSPVIPSLSQTKVGLSAIENTNFNSFLDTYRQSAPQAVACVFKKKELLQASSIQGYLWDSLELSFTRVYYHEELKGINPGDEIEIFFQLRSLDQFAVCGLSEHVEGLAVKIKYINPDRPFELLFNDQSYFADPHDTYKPASFNEFSSVFRIIQTFNYTGRYNIYVALIPIGGSDKNIENLKYKKVKYTEIYVKNSR